MPAADIRWHNQTAIDPVCPRSRDGFPRRRVAFPFLILVGLILVGFLASSAWTQDGPARLSQEIRAFRIPSQPLADALQAYSQATGIEILYESSIAEGVQSSEVDGSYPPKLALGILLTYTDLIVHYTRSNAITLSLPRADGGNLPPSRLLADADLALETLRVTDGERPDAGKLRAFSESVQFDIERALRSDTRTKGGNYRVSLKLWVDTSPVVSRVELARSTGDSVRDASIVTILQGLVLRSGPPLNTPQPVRVAIVVRSL